MTKTYVRIDVAQELEVQVSDWHTVRGTRGPRPPQMGVDQGPVASAPSAPPQST